MFSALPELLITELPEILRRKIAAQDAPELRLIIAQQAMDEAELPDGARVTHRPLRGRRVVVKGPRPYGNISSVTARWPRDGLMEDKTVPKLAYVARGQTDYQVGEFVIHCNEGCFMLLPPATPHPNGETPHLEEARQKSGELCTIIWFQPWETGLRSWICHSRGNRHYNDLESQEFLIFSARAHELLLLLGEEGEQRKSGYERVCKSLLTALFAVLDREFLVGNWRLSHAEASLQMKGASGPSTQDPIERAQQYICSHLGEPLTIEAVARKAHLSRGQFVREFRRKTGQTFLEFLTERRLEKAKVMIAQTDWSLLAIGGHAGFKSYPYFCTLFRKREGLTPGEFRQRSLQKSRRRKLPLKKEPNQKDDNR